LAALSVSSGCCGGGQRGVSGIVLGLIGKAEGRASLMRRTLVRTSAPIFNSLRRMVPQEARRCACASRDFRHRRISVDNPLLRPPQFVASAENSVDPTSNEFDSQVIEKQPFQRGQHA
jgi:hypothetical protein